MTHQRDEEVIGGALEDLREADETAAPAFDAIQHRPRPVYRLDTRRAALLAVAAGVVLVTGAAVVREATKPRFVVPSDVIALSSWRPMTDALLETLPDVPGDAPLTASLLPMARPDSTMEKMP